MTQKSLTIRVENLESAVAELVRLPRQMEDLSSQFLQLREDVREEISGVRSDVGLVQMELAGALLSTEKRLSTEMRSLHEDLIQRIALIGETRPGVEEADGVSPVRPRRSRKGR